MKKNRLYTLLALLVILFWGTTFVSTKILLTRLSPVQIMLLRYLIAIRNFTARRGCVRSCAASPRRSAAAPSIFWRKTPRSPIRRHPT